MKTHLFFMLIFLLFFSCGYDVEFQTAEMQPALTDVLSLELSFGDEKTIVKDEFLLAKPSDLIVNDEGDIYIFDEGKIKVFDKNGKEKQIIGGPGQGPSEFGSRVHNMWHSPAGYITVQERSYYSLFSPDNEFMVKRNFRNISSINNIFKEHKLSESNNPFHIIALNEHECILFGTDLGFSYVAKDNIYYDFLFYVKDDSVTLITKQKNVDSFVLREADSFWMTRIGLLGNLSYVLLPGKKILYSHSAHDVTVEMGIGQAVLHVVSLENMEKYDISYFFEPREITKSEINDVQYSGTRKRVGEDIKSAMRKAKYYAPFFNIYAEADGNMVFLYSGSDTEYKSNFFSVIDTEKRKYVCSMVIPMLPSCIKNGFLYKYHRPEDEFPYVEKYKIDPAVYGK